MLKNIVVSSTLLVLCACQAPQQTALLERDKAIEWDAVIATDVEHHQDRWWAIL